MDFTIIMDADDLSSDFLKYIKSSFMGKGIKLTVEVEPDATEYLMSDHANHERIMKTVTISKKQ